MKDYKYKYLYCILTTCSSITNGLPGVYFGKHSTNDLNDGYIGSGKLLKKYIKKHPKEYERYIIGFYNSEEELNKAEYNIIHNILHMPICINMTEGGTGGKNIINVYKNDPTFNKGKRNPMYGKNPRDYMTLEACIKKDKNQSAMMKGEGNPMYGKGYLLVGEKNPAFGCKWMSNGIDRVFSKPTEFDKYILMGYHFGKK